MKPLEIQKAGSTHIGLCLPFDKTQFLLSGKSARIICLAEYITSSHVKEKILELVGFHR